MAARRRWVLIAFGAAVLVVFIGIGVMIAVAAWFQQNMQVDARSAEQADAEFTEISLQFGDRLPLLEMLDGRPAFTPEHDKPAPAQSTRIETLHMLAWNPREGRVARFNLPFWLIRMKSTPFRFSTYASGLDDRVDLRPSDIDKYGPGIILDAHTPSGEHVMLWAR
jgi:hypothetical protein